MIMTKAASFSTEERNLAVFTRAIAHPARIAILNILAQRNSCVCGEIVEGLPLAQATVSQHLKALKQAGLIKGTISGAKSCYCINWDAIEQFKEAFNGLFTQMHAGQSACCVPNR